MFGSIRTLAVAGAALLGTTGWAAAGDDYCPPRYQSVVCYETRTAPRTVCITRYDECGHPYIVRKTVYVPVRVAVTKRVAVY